MTLASAILSLLPGLWLYLIVLRPQDITVKDPALFMEVNTVEGITVALLGMSITLSLSGLLPL